MSLFEFEKGDIIRNTIVSYPKNKFLFYKGDVIYNDSVQELESDWDPSTDNLSKYIPSGHISLYELNIDRPSGTNDDNLIRPFAYPGTGWQPTAFQTIFINDIEYVATRDSSGTLVPALVEQDPTSGVLSFSIAPSTTEATTLNDYRNNFGNKEMYGHYPLSSSISSEYHNTPASGNIIDDPAYPAPNSLVNVINFYRYLGSHFDSAVLFGDDFNMISIPSIFYGNKINPGSTRLELIVAGSQSENITLTDFRKNGELLDQNGDLHGVVLYNEGFVILTGAAQISDNDTGAPNDDSTSWRDFAVNSASRTNLAWSIEFEGVTETPVMTMFAHARKNELNHSNNPSFLKLRLPATSSNSHVYREEDSKEIRNVTKTDLLEEEPIFEKETYISKIAIYDDQKKVIGYARLARPIRKTEEREMTFKLKIDL